MMTPPITALVLRVAKRHPSDLAFSVRRFIYESINIQLHGLYRILLLKVRHDHPHYKQPRSFSEGKSIIYFCIGEYITQCSIGLGNHNMEIHSELMHFRRRVATLHHRPKISSGIYFEVFLHISQNIIRKEEFVSYRWIAQLR